MDVLHVWSRNWFSKASLQDSTFMYSLESPRENIRKHSVHWAAVGSPFTQCTIWSLRGRIWWILWRSFTSMRSLRYAYRVIFEIASPARSISRSSSKWNTVNSGDIRTAPMSGAGSSHQPCHRLGTVIAIDRSAVPSAPGRRIWVEYRFADVHLTRW